MLNSEHIDYIIKDLSYRGIIADEVQDELIDHVCSAVESEMARGERFIDAYDEVLKSFGHTAGLRRTQKKTILYQNLTTRQMFKNYLTIAVRNLGKQRFYSIINVAGLAVGIAACLIIILFIVDELQYDRYHVKADRIYRVDNELKYGGNQYNLAVTPPALGQAILQDFPEVESTVRLRSYGTYLVRAENNTDNLKEQNVIWTDSTFFSIFSVKVLEGNPKRALAEPACIAVSKRIADKYFPNGNAMGQILVLDNKYHGKITAVYENIPANSHFHFDILVSLVGDWAVAREANRVDFLSNNFNTYLLLKPGTNAKALESKLPGLVQKHIAPQLAAALGNDFTLEKFKSAGNKYELSLMSLSDIHLHSDLQGELEPNGNLAYIYLFSAVALLILVIACINFMNLSTARSSNRAKEVGIRKVMGSLRPHLTRQFLTESTLITVFAFVVAVGLAYLMIPFFNDLSAKDLRMPLGDPGFYAMLLICAILIGLLAGLYPSFFLSAFKPIDVLKGKLALGMRSGLVRSALVVFQFVISILLIIGAITVHRQLSFIQNKKLGFQKDQIIIVHDAYALRPNKAEPFKQEALKLPFIESATISGFLPVEVANAGRNYDPFWREGLQPTPENLISIQDWGGDYDYIKTFDIKIKEGRAFSSQFPSDSSAVVLNEAAVIQFGLGKDPVGKKISSFSDYRRPDGSPDPAHVKSWTVIGVMKDFHFSSLKEGIKPLALFIRKSDGFVCFKFNAKNSQEVVGSLQRIWKSLAPGQPFQYSFLDQDFEHMYSSEQRLGKIFSIFAGLAIIIACLGLFALTAFTAEQKTKEIGIRKVLGASVGSIIVLLSKEFGKLILAAFFLAAPLAWFAVNWWLRGYTYKAEIGIMVYVLAGLSAFLVAWLTMSFQSIKAARNNPVNSLRSE